jgi:hypothetical protein
MINFRPLRAQWQPQVASWSAGMQLSAFRLTGRVNLHAGASR